MDSYICISGKRYNFKTITKLPPKCNPLEPFINIDDYTKYPILIDSKELWEEIEEC